MGQIHSANLKAEDAPAAPRTLVAIPCYNEELAIGSLVLRAKRYATQVIVIDDGSQDQTVEVAREAGAAVLTHGKNQGKGAAIRNAFRYAWEKGFDAVVLMDGDGQHDPDEIPTLFEPVLRRDGNAADIALGFRFGGRTEMPMWRRMGKRVLDYATAAGGAKVVTDSQCGYRAFGKRAIQEMATGLREDGFGSESEQLLLAQSAQLSLQNVPITCKYEGIDGSTKGPIQHATSVLTSLLEMVTARRPLLCLGLPSLVLIIVAGALAIYTLQSYNMTGIFSVPYALAAITIAMIGTFGAFSALILHLVSTLERRLKQLGGA